MKGTFKMLLFAAVYLAATKAVSTALSSTLNEPPANYYSRRRTFEVIISQQMTWYDSMIYCKSRQGDLATIRSQEENDEVVELIGKTGLAAGPAVSVGFWLGGARLASSSDWFWMTDGDTTKRFENWHDGQPNNFGGNQTALQYSYYPQAYGGSSSVKWNDDNILNLRYIVCEY
uniref:Perlucin-like protein n=1 Tax=Lygus hesperus TaxID=30085 RepID=A0A0A9YM97_LYGHE